MTLNICEKRAEGSEKAFLHQSEDNWDIRLVHGNNFNFPCTVCEKHLILQNFLEI